MPLFMVWLHVGPSFILNADGSVRLEGLDNHAMGTVFEELMWGFNEEAGEHFTPRDVVRAWELRLHAGADEVRSGTYLIYDGACGARGMLTVAATKRAPGIAPPPGEGKRLFVERLTVTGDRASAALRAATDQDSVFGPSAAPKLLPRFFGLARLEERERIDYDLPLHGQPFFDFAWEDGPHR